MEKHVYVTARSCWPILGKRSLGFICLLWGSFHPCFIGLLLGYETIINNNIRLPNKRSRIKDVKKLGSGLERSTFDKSYNWPLLAITLLWYYDQSLSFK